MNKMCKFDIFVNVWVSLIINIVLSSVLPLVVNGMLTPAVFLKGFAIAFTVSTALYFGTRSKSGPKVCRAFQSKAAKLHCPIAVDDGVTLILGILMSLFMTAFNEGIGPWFIDAWLSCYGWTLLSVYVSAIIGAITAIPLATKLFGVPEAEVS
jgi:hypothetical protein